MSPCKWLIHSFHLTKALTLSEKLTNQANKASLQKTNIIELLSSKDKLVLS